MTHDRSSEARRVWLSLGSNLGDRWSHLNAPVVALRTNSVFDQIRLSSVYETEPVGGPVQPHFLNAVVEFRTQLSAPEILKWAQSQEEDADRQRIEHWGPRTLDVDIIAIEGECVSSADLVVPHPRAHQRAFVVVPWAELIDPQSVLGERIDIDEGGVTVVAPESYPMNSPFREVTT